jgi:tetratricopeptide (TPR) repeat protein
MNMSYSENRDLIKAEKLIEEGKIEKALQLVNDFGKKKDLPYIERISYYTLKSILAGYFHDRKECRKYAEKAYQVSQKLDNSLLLLDVYIQMAYGLGWYLERNEGDKFIKNSEDLLKILPQEVSTDITKRKARILFLKGNKYYQKGELEKAIEYAEQSLAQREELDLKADIVLSLFQLGMFSWLNGDLNRALEYTKSCKTLANNLNLKQIIHRCYKQFGIIYDMKGELDKALNYNEQVLAFAEKENNSFLIADMYNNIGMTYQEKGDFSRALEYLEKSITFKEKRGTNLEIFIVSDSLFHLALDMNDLKKAQRYLNQIKQIADKEKNQSNLYYKTFYSLNRALYLKNSPRGFNRGKAEQMLKQQIEEGISDFEGLKRALLNLCDLLLFELHATSEPEILDELQIYISQLFDAVKTSRSYSLLAETYLLQARLSLITLDMIKARQFLTKAQEIADRYGLNRLAIKISNEHDELLNKLDVWEKLKDSKVSLSERMELARLDEQMDAMIRKREINIPEIPNEEPVHLIIVSEGGKPFFSQTFIEDQFFEDHLFGGFLSAINSFISEMFSEGLDRVIFGDHTILVNSLSPFFICYVFKGQSYSAQLRIKTFIDEIHSNKQVWDTFEEYYKANREVQLKDVPSLKPLIKETFIDSINPLV